jgi:molybdopterin/thiamine biosynthesis adenylyltransferase
MKVKQLKRYDIDKEVFSRQVLVDGWNQKKVEEGKVLVVGAGALGNEIVKNLVLSGIRKIYLVDFDRVVNANLSRCIFFYKKDAVSRRLKAHALASNATRMRINPKTEIVPIERDLLKMSGDEEFFEDSDVYVSALDNVIGRLALNLKSLAFRKPLVDGGMEGFHGYVRVVVPGKTACLECNTNKEILSERTSCSGRIGDDGTILPLASISTTTSIIAGIQTQEILKLLIDPDEKIFKTLAGKILYYLGETNFVSVLEVEKRKDCICNLATST